MLIFYASKRSVSDETKTSNLLHRKSESPAHIRRFSGAIGQLVKIDKLDAQLIAHYEPALSKLKLAVIRLMSDLLSRRGQLITLHTMEKNRLCIMPKGVPEYIKPI